MYDLGSLAMLREEAGERQEAEGPANEAARGCPAVAAPVSPEDANTQWRDTIERRRRGSP